MPALALRVRVMVAAMPMGQLVSRSIFPSVSLRLSVCGLWIMMERNNWPRDGDGDHFLFSSVPISTMMIMAMTKS